MVTTYPPTKKIAILGISALYHDAAACVLVDGTVVAAAQEERFSRIKNDPRFPRQAITYCLQEAGVALHELDAVVFYEKPLLTLERLLETHLYCAPWGVRAFISAMVDWMQGKLFSRHLLKKHLRELDPKAKAVPVLFSEHHLSHAASAFFPSPFTKAAILTVDGVGEWTTLSVGYGSGASLRLIKEMTFPHSLGLLYSSFTDYLGFEINSGEQKCMGLSSYADPLSPLVQQFKKNILTEMVHLKPDGSFTLNLSYFNFPVGVRMSAEAQWRRLFNVSHRMKDTEVTEIHIALARAAQEVCEDIMLALARSAKEVTQSDALCLAGGVALNCLANTRLREARIFKNIWVQPAPGDAGGALGAALATHHLYFMQNRTLSSPDSMRGAYLGPEFTDADIEKTLRTHNLSFITLPGQQALCTYAADLLADGKVIGWFQGRMEFGPRALGNRSILADPRSATMRARINSVVKRRESFRPFGPSILFEHTGDYFDDTTLDPYMLFVKHILPAQRSAVPAVIHHDGSSRVQGVTSASNPLYYALLQAFKLRTGCPLLLNTSFNVRDEPVVGSPEDALTTFLQTDLDALIMGSHVVSKHTPHV